MSWGISENAPQHEKIFTEFADNLNGMNCCGEIDYDAYSKIFDTGRKLKDESYQQGREDAINEFIEKYKNSGCDKHPCVSDELCVVCLAEQVKREKSLGKDY